MNINLESLIRKNIKQHEFRKRLVQDAYVEEIYPTITISRDPGSGGKAVAEKVAKLLKIKMFDNELIDMVAKETKSRRRLVKALDERSQSNVKSIVNSFLGLESLSSNTFIKSFATVVLSIASNQPAVILGRGMNFVLPTTTNLRVRITAPRKTLIKYAVKYEHRDINDAREVIDHYMKARRDFVHKYFSKDLRKSHYYDLVLNTECMSLDDVSKIIVFAFKQKFNI